MHVCGKGGKIEKWGSKTREELKEYLNMPQDMMLFRQELQFPLRILTIQDPAGEEVVRFCCAVL